MHRRDQLRSRKDEDQHRRPTLVVDDEAGEVEIKEGCRRLQAASTSNERRDESESLEGSPEDL